jgi:hypothetical protein
MTGWIWKGSSCVENEADVLFAVAVNLELGIGCLRV